mmetsp:Transcript_34070/g.89577  ORF Transcript_34070/g.89577 Transcript_34070/m.89577 type:complete len:371 (-) Transcript_34070:418-1530(-)
MPPEEGHGDDERKDRIVFRRRTRKIDVARAVLAVKAPMRRRSDSHERESIKHDHHSRGVALDEEVAGLVLGKGVERSGVDNAHQRRQRHAQRLPPQLGRAEGESTRWQLDVRSKEGNHGEPAEYEKGDPRAEAPEEALPQLGPLVAVDGRLGRQVRAGFLHGTCHPPRDRCRRQHGGALRGVQRVREIGETVRRVEKLGTESVVEGELVVKAAERVELPRQPPHLKRVHPDCPGEDADECCNQDPVKEMHGQEQQILETEILAERNAGGRALRLLAEHHERAQHLEQCCEERHDQNRDRNAHFRARSVHCEVVHHEARKRNVFQEDGNKRIDAELVALRLGRRQEAHALVREDSTQKADGAFLGTLIHLA